MINKKPSIGTGVVVFNKYGQILMGRRVYKPEGYSLPGGHLEFGETLIECAKREVFEEVGIEIENIEIATIGENLFLDREFHSISIFLISTIKEGEILKNPEPDKCDGWSWVGLDSLPKKLSFNYDPIFKDVFKILKSYINRIIL
ncbi:NUDIX domain-containing protein [Thiospirochaeta perfilievii]|uniref:NUDIX domain-containing protein n=1 Tax=Thiospirochaeta perfilievii TaxID=252967 RepID=A0A5C1QBT7_9SPIO|nr:NUDIX domain-containing protein [Thiospirochaeta perfilievii]QEN03662.1 NUDIX domain-containing protein [Thiospirochaeta perfilievii]